MEVRLDHLYDNAAALVGRLAEHDIAVTGVTKATLGDPVIAGELLRGGVAALGDARIENLERLRRAGIVAPLVLIRGPMLSQVDRVVASADVSLNTEPVVVAALSAAATRRGTSHGVVLMVELGDLREGLLPDDVEAVARRTLALPGLTLRGIGTNLACQSGVAPDARNMGELTALAAELEAKLGICLEVVSGGNSANLDWALGGADTGRVNNLRLGEAILLGCEPLRRCPIEGLHTDAFTLVAEVIEHKVKPSRAWGVIAQTAFGPGPATIDTGSRHRSVLAIGRQDVDPAGLHPPNGTTILGASSDQLVVDPGSASGTVGSEMRFQLTYEALLSALTSPYVATCHLRDGRSPGM